MGDRYVISDENIEISHFDANIVYGWAMSESVHYDGNECDEIVKLEELSKNADDSDIGFFVDVDLKYPDYAKEKTKCFPFCPQNEIGAQGKISDYMNEMNQINPHKTGS